MLRAPIGSKSSLQPDLPSIGGSSSIGSFDFSRLSGQQTTPSQAPEILSFRDYIPLAWPVIEPAIPFVTGYHVDAIAEHLQAISDGELRNLIINIPPRHSKSSLVCVLWPTWKWTFDPWFQWLFASYKQDLSVRDSVKCRRLILSDWYQQRWGSVFQLTGDQNQKTRFENDQNGHRLAISVGTGTGEGGDGLVMDDPMSDDQAQSEHYREGANDWVDGTFSTRGNNPLAVVRVIVMQRLHEADTTAHVLKRAEEGGEKYDHLILPAEYEPRVQICLADKPKQHDPRTEEGELLSPERFPREEIEKLTINLQDKAPGQLQQRPSPPGGAIYKRECWANGRNRYDPRDVSLYTKTLARWLSYDTAFKVGEENDFTGLSVFDLLTDYRVLVRWVEMRKLEFPDLVGTVEDDARRWNYDGKLQAIVIEDAGSGISLVQTLKAGSDQRLAERVIPHKPKGSKPARARAMSLWCSLDMVLLPVPCDDVPWLFDFAGDEPGGRLYRFPTLEHDDDIDSFTQGLWELEPHLKQGYEARLGRAAA